MTLVISYVTFNEIHILSNPFIKLSIKLVNKRCHIHSVTYLIMERVNYNICSLIFQREISGKFVNKKLGKTNLIREDLNKLCYEDKSVYGYPVERYDVNINYDICVLFFHDDNEDFLEDLHVCGYDYDGVFIPYLFDHHCTFYH